MHEEVWGEGGHIQMEWNDKDPSPILGFLKKNFLYMSVAKLKIKKHFYCLLEN